ncbi:hypothetical protein K9M74_04135 [Candidatus Woesearchaeota archaeon]|nr:hypothetical protein [Candidatus Woesearchaeota archaeon]
MNKNKLFDSSLSSDNDSIHTLMIVPADVTELQVLAQGKRGIVFKGVYKGQDVAVKIPRPSSEAPNTMGLEATYLKKVNKLRLGPKLFVADNDYVVMEFIHGKRIGDFLADISTSPETILIVLNKILTQLFTLDKAGINKYELTNPYKHIIVQNNNEPVLIDFERARHAAKPKNINQFVQYLQSTIIRQLLTGIIDYERLALHLKRYQETQELFVLSSSQREKDDIGNKNTKE